MNTTTDTTIDNSGSFPVATGSEIVNNSTIPASTSGGDVESIMRKMADQQSQIANLSKQLETKWNDVEKLSQKQRDEMMHVYQTVIKGWLDAQESVDPKTREEFNNGISNLAKNADDNGIWCLYPINNHMYVRTNHQIKNTPIQSKTQPSNIHNNYQI